MRATTLARTYLLNGCTSVNDIDLREQPNLCHRASTNRLAGLTSLRLLRPGSINGSPCQSLEVLRKLEYSFLGVRVVQ
jgi:hypothetical protein